MTELPGGRRTLTALRLWTLRHGDGASAGAEARAELAPLILDAAQALDRPHAPELAALAWLLLRLDWRAVDPSARGPLWPLDHDEGRLQIILAALRHPDLPAEAARGVNARTRVDTADLRSAVFAAARRMEPAAVAAGWADFEARALALEGALLAHEPLAATTRATFWARAHETLRGRPEVQAHQGAWAVAAAARGGETA